MSARIESVNVAVVQTGPWTGRKRRSGIDKRPVGGPVEIRDDMVAGDSVIDRRFHGGPDKAVYAYAREDAAWWSAELGRELTDGNFGENLTTSGIDLTSSVIGDLWHVGSTVLQVCSPRIPCRVFAGFWDVPDLIKRFTAHGTPGAYLRIMTPGSLTAGDEITVSGRPAHGLTIGRAFRGMTGDRSVAPELVNAPELPEKYRTQAAGWLKTG